MSTSQGLLFRNENDPCEILYVERACIDSMKNYFNLQYEQGGIIGTTCGLFHLTCFLPDFNHVYEVDKYVPDTKNLNRLIKKCALNKICFLGIVHSHVNGCDRFSLEDKKYIYKQLRAFPHLPFMWFPIVFAKNGMVFYKCSLYKGKVVSEKFIQEVIADE